MRVTARSFYVPSESRPAANVSRRAARAPAAPGGSCGGGGRGAAEPCGAVLRAVQPSPPSPDRSRTLLQAFFFAYNITIRNESQATVKLVERCVRVEGGRACAEACGAGDRAVTPRQGLARCHRPLARLPVVAALICPTHLPAPPARPSPPPHSYWFITNGQGQSQEVRGPGVVGEQPELAPGEEFTYQVGAPLPAWVCLSACACVCLCQPQA